MGQVVYVLGLFVIAGVIFGSSADQYSEKNIRKSSLILEYNWPEPSKSLNRLPHPRSCTHFIHTKKDGTHVVKRCHGDKFFDYRTLRCQHKSSAKCWMNIVKKGNIKKVKRPFSCPFPWGLYPDKEDCSLFYDCMGGKIYSRKCPDSTLFDAVEKICVHSKKALCAGDSDIIAKKLKSIPSKRHMDSEEQNLEEIGKKYRTKFENKFIISELSSTLTATENSKLLKTTDVDSKEDRSEEIGEKYRTKSKNELLTSELPFTSTSTADPKSLRTNEYSEEKNNPEENINEISSDYEFKSKLPKIQNSFDSNYSKKLTSKINLSSTEKRRITQSSQSSDSSGLPIKSTIIESFVNPENELKPSSTSITPGDSKKDANINVNTEKIIFPTERISKKLTSSEVPSNQNSLKDKITVIPEGSKVNSNINDEITKVTWPTKITSKEFISSSELSGLQKTDSTEKIRFTPDSFTINPAVIRDFSEVSTTYSIVCSDSDGNFPHPKNDRLYIACIRGKPSVKECPPGVVFIPHLRHCYLF